MKKTKQTLYCSVFSVLLAALLTLGSVTGVTSTDYEENAPQNIGTIVYEVADKEGNVVKKPSDEELNIMVSILQVRLANLGYIEAKVAVKETNRVEIKIPNVENLEELATSLSQTGYLTFEDLDGNVLLDGSMVKSAEYAYGPVNETGVDVSHVLLTFTKEGQEAFTAATDMIASRMDGTNVMCICLDGEVYSAPTVYEKIDASSCIITGDFNKESATELASIISGGRLPYELKILSTEFIDE